MTLAKACKTRKCAPVTESSEVNGDGVQLVVFHDLASPFFSEEINCLQTNGVRDALQSTIVLFKGCVYVPTCNAVQLLCPKRSKTLSSTHYCWLFVGPSK